MAAADSSSNSPAVTLPAQAARNAGRFLAEFQEIGKQQNQVVSKCQNLPTRWGQGRVKHSGTLVEGNGKDTSR